MAAICLGLNVSLLLALIGPNFDLFITRASVTVTMSMRSFIVAEALVQYECVWEKTVMLKKCVKFCIKSLNIHTHF